MFLFQIYIRWPVETEGPQDAKIGQTHTKFLGLQKFSHINNDEKIKIRQSTEMNFTRRVCLCLAFIFSLSGCKTVAGDLAGQIVLENVLGPVVDPGGSASSRREILG